MVVPAAETPFKRIARALVPQLSAHGRHVTAMPAGLDSRRSTDQLHQPLHQQT